MGISALLGFSWVGAAGGGPAQSPRTHLCLHQVDPLGPELTHAVEDVHHPFVLGHVEHGVDGDEAAGPPGSSTRRKDRGLCQGLGAGPALGRPLTRPVPRDPAER